jgi:hypothetical protein
VRFGSNLEPFLVFLFIYFNAKHSFTVTQMKKTYMIVLFVASITAMIPTLVMADTLIVKERYNSNLSTLSALSFSEENSLDSMFAIDDHTDKAPLSYSDQPYVIVRGKWGNGSDPDFDGYFDGRITFRMTQVGNRIGIFRGLYNKTSEDEKYSLVGIMKKGYFIGKITTSDAQYKFTGLYYIDQENQLLKMQWMIPRNAGWAIAQIQIS